MDDNQTLKVNLIAAVGNNLELGLNGLLPWNLPNEYATFIKIAKGNPPAGRKNVIIFGRKTWLAYTARNPLAGKMIEIIISRTLKKVPGGAHVFSSLDAAMAFLSQPEQRNRVHEVWITGGSMLYKTGLESEYFHRLYLTKVYGDFESDTWFPEVDLSSYHTVRDERLPVEVQEENGIKYQFFVYEKQTA
ncbi:Dihydrofolate reductase [Holothuria leucospilota]|uniref:dihydrofolate reductase n=1 Tax=Holothuria leucospilota TaxID=206669 RepID=A0A9Q1BY99_HOLLE|nr:Dihydrofolate reductase [Holothuria leucospilota]